jgi:hypothetical protein
MKIKDGESNRVKCMGSKCNNLFDESLISRYDFIFYFSIYVFMFFTVLSMNPHFQNSITFLLNLMLWIAIVESGVLVYLIAVMQVKKFYSFFFFFLFLLLKKQFMQKALHLKEFSLYHFSKIVSQWKFSLEQLLM